MNGGSGLGHRRCQQVRHDDALTLRGRGPPIPPSPPATQLVESRLRGRCEIMLLWFFLSKLTPRGCSQVRCAKDPLRAALGFTPRPTGCCFAVIVCP